MRTDSIELLKRTVEDSFGHRILSAGDCLQLCDSIHKKTGHKLNINTLRRCFGLVKTPYNPSGVTLNILAQYCGFAGYSQFTERSCSGEDNGVLPGEDKKLVEYLVALFTNTKVQHRNDPTFLSSVKQALLLLGQEPRLIQRFQKLIAKTENGQNFYFEQFVNIDKLASYYGEGLTYYLAAKKTPDAQLFGNGLLCFRSWLTGDKEGVAYYFNKVATIEVGPATHPYIGGQYFACHLFNAALTGGDLDSIASEARLFFRQIKPSKEDYRFFPGFEMVMADALLQVQLYDEALYYIEGALKKREAELPAYMDGQLYHAFHLFYAIALAGTGKGEKAREEIKKIDINQFYFLRNHYYSIYYLLLKRWSGRQSAKTITQLDHLVAVTGFTFFKNYRLQQGPDVEV